jgi:radical SAM protein with 4Fe4S-binding SPASM domain
VVAGAPLSEDLVLRAEDYRHFPPPTAADRAHYEAPVLQGPVCSAGRSLFALSPTGDVYPCVICRRSMGNVRETPLAQIWNSPAMLAVSRLDRRDLAGCAGCADRAFCTFCMGQSYNATGSIDQPVPTLCQRARRLHEALRRAPCGVEP